LSVKPLLGAANHGSHVAIHVATSRCKPLQTVENGR